MARLQHRVAPTPARTSPPVAILLRGALRLSPRSCREGGTGRFRGVLGEGGDRCHATVRCLTRTSPRSSGPSPICSAAPTSSSNTALSSYLPNLADPNFAALLLI